ncbi:polypeptide N-acetylgalactosaminyltransferase 1-like [Oratosquilla oratoria]|uniref:polypeptide N-acetylgalactosaminyltransferase 1-like n=1 Tax=Oratosquilla oratoria TaxID=337810 RepID=UPI003F767A8D
MGLCRRRWRVLGFALGVLFFILIIHIHVPKAQKDVTDDDIMIPLKSRHKNQEEYIDKRGIHVVVGHYLGDEVPGKTTPNLTHELLNSNGYSPQPHAGEMGNPVQIPAWEAARMQQLYHINKFNLLASDRISVNRSLPDVRKKQCQGKDYQVDRLPSTSIIIVFHNEAWSTLLRTVHSVINRSPRRLLKEIIMVDDASERDFLKKPLEDYVAKLSVPVRVIRSDVRTGLIRARLLGAQVAQGDTLTFLDAHCEATTGWLEPLLSGIAEDRTRVVCPIIDIINDDNFQYVRSFELHWGAFNWNLHFRWYALGHREVDQRKKDTTKAYRTPAMAGGLFSIEKDFFYQIGSYDRNMDVWGGENLEMSFRVWMCGGSVEIAPCSHVGHVFRKSSPYTFPGKGGVGSILYRNLARVATVWLDDWADFYFKMNPEADRVRDEVNVRERLVLRNRMQCQDFQWYLDNVWPEHFLPTKDRFFGKIRHEQKGGCLQKPGIIGTASQPTGPTVIKDCVIEAFQPQLFVFTKKGYIMTDESVCLDAPDASSSKDPQVRIMACNELPRQKWTYDEPSKQIRHVQSGLCLDLPSQTHPDTLSLQLCDSTLRSQRWIFEDVKWSRNQ